MQRHASTAVLALIVSRARRLHCSVRRAAIAHISVPHPKRIARRALPAQRAPPAAPFRSSATLAPFQQAVHACAPAVQPASIRAKREGRDAPTCPLASTRSLVQLLRSLVALGATQRQRGSPTAPSVRRAHFNNLAGEQAAAPAQRPTTARKARRLQRHVSQAHIAQTRAAPRQTIATPAPLARRVYQPRLRTSPALRGATAWLERPCAPRCRRAPSRTRRVAMGARFAGLATIALRVRVSPCRAPVALLASTRAFGLLSSAATLDLARGRRLEARPLLPAPRRASGVLGEAPIP